jgi:hypothetical protein
MNSTIDLNKSDYVRYIETLECSETKKHFANQFVLSQTKFDSIDNSIKIVNKILAEIRDQHEPVKLYEAYKMNKQAYKKEVEDKIIQKGSLIESIKNIAILATGAAGIILYIFQMHFK